MASQAEVAVHLDLSQPAVSMMVRDGVLPKPAARGALDLDACRVAYVRHLREQAAGRAPISNSVADLDLVRERARLAKAQADGQEMKNDIARSEVVLVADVTRAIGVCCSRVRNRLLAMPAEDAPQLHACRTVPEVQGLLMSRVVAALTELSNIEVTNAE